MRQQLLLLRLRTAFTADVPPTKGPVQKDNNMIVPQGQSPQEYGKFASSQEAAGGRSHPQKFQVVILS